MSAPCKPNEYRLIRLYNAPVQAVWDAWTDLDQVAQWWGPRGFTITTHSKDLKVGGHWRYTMHGPDGTDYPNVTKYHDVESRKRLVYDHGGGDDQPPLFRVTVTFAEKVDGTEMDMTCAFASADVAAQMVGFIRAAGGNGTWDRLAEFLVKKGTNKDAFVLNYSFDASPERVFGMWTDAEQLKAWLPPQGFAMEFKRSMIKQGQSTFFRMHGGNGVEIHSRTHYVQIDPHRQIVMQQDFCDRDENLARHPLAPELPQTILTTVQFASEGAGTRVTLTSISGDHATATEVASFVAERQGMSHGWTGSFEKLAAKLLEG